MNHLRIHLLPKHCSAAIILSLIFSLCTYAQVIDCDPLIINDSPIYNEWDPPESDTLFIAMGSFIAPPDSGVRYLLTGGPIFIGAFGWKCCIGGARQLILKINETVVVDYDSFAASYQLLDPYHEGIDITGFVNPGTNTFSVVVRGHIFVSPQIQFLTRLWIWAVLPPVGIDVEPYDTLITTGEDTPIYATAVDRCENTSPWWDIADSTPVTFTAIQEQIYGNFINPAGDTVPSPVTVSYGEALLGNISFIANGVVPDTVVTVTIHASMTNPALSGEAVINVKNADTLVTIKRPNTVAVYPTYPGHNDSTTKKNWMDLELRVALSDSSPVPNYSVRLDTTALVDSGGHSHNGARPMGRYVVPKLTGQGVDTISSGMRKTDSTGVLKFKYLASQFGGVERITARLVSDTTKFDTLSLTTRVPGLQLLPEGTNYVKGGGTCLHHGPSTTEPIACRTPDNNHWGTQPMIDSLRAALLKFYRWSGSSKGGGQYVILKINDMSLPLGGVFDIAGDWRLNYHLYHRVGLSVDINFQGLDSTHVKELTSIMKKKKGKRNRERPQIHYGFFGGD